MRVDSPGNVATLVPDVKPREASPGASSQAPPPDRHTEPQTARAVREPPSVADLPPRDSRSDGGGVDILV
ncbi:MAG: hypothetical protein ACTSX7_14290 [Alphaproteobacteria bacterium]